MSVRAAMNMLFRNSLIICSLGFLGPSCKNDAEFQSSNEKPRQFPKDKSTVAEDMHETPEEIAQDPLAPASTKPKDKILSQDSGTKNDVTGERSDVLAVGIDASTLTDANIKFCRPNAETTWIFNSLELALGGNSPFYDSCGANRIVLTDPRDIRLTTQAQQILEDMIRTEAIILACYFDRKSNVIMEVSHENRQKFVKFPRAAVACYDLERYNQ